MELALLLLGFLVVILLTEKKSKVISLTHLALLLFLLAFYPYISEEKWASELAISWIGQDTYEILHTAFIEGVPWLAGSFSALLVLETVTIWMLMTAAFISTIHALSEMQRTIALARRISINSRAEIVASIRFMDENRTIEPVDYAQAPSYLTLCQLRN